MLSGSLIIAYLHDEVYVEKAKQTIQLVEEFFLRNLTINGNDLYY